MPITNALQPVPDSIDYLQFIEFSPVALFIEVDGKFAAANRAALKFFGAEIPEQLIGRPILEIVHPDHHQLVSERLRDVHAGKTNPPIEEKLVRLDGKVAFAEVGSAPYFHRGKMGAQVFLRDIDRRKQAEEAARQSEERFRILFESAPMAISVARGETLLYANSAYLKIFGYTDITEVHGHSMMEHMAPQCRHIIQDRIERRKIGEVVPNDYESIGRRKDGSEFPYHVKLSRIKLDDGWATVAFINDITERKRVEEDLEKSLSTLKATLESTADGILVVNHEGKISGYNQKFIQMWGLPETILAGKDDSEALAFVLKQLKDPEAFLRKVNELYARPEAESFDMLEFKDGRVFERYSQPERVRDHHVGRVWSFRDVTEQQQMQRRDAALLEVGNKLSSAETREQAGRSILEVCSSLFGWDACSLHLYDAENDIAKALISVDTIDGKKVDVPPTYVDRRPSALAKSIIQNGAQLILRQPPFDFNPNARRFGDKSRPSVSIMLVPVRNAQKVIGLLSIHSYTPNAYRQEDLAVLQSLADHCAGALDRIQNREELRRSEELFRTLSESSPLGIFKNDAEGRLIYVNDRWTEISGLSIAESIEFGWAKVLHPADRDAFWEKREQGMAAGAGWSSEHRLITTQGKTRWIRVLAMPITAPEGTPSGYVGTIEDITERKRAELATTAFSKLGQSLSSATSPKEAARIILGIADDLLGWDSCYLEINSNEENKVHRILNLDIIDGQRQEIAFDKPIQGPHPAWRKTVEAAPQLFLRDGPNSMPSDSRPFGDASRPSASLMFVPIRHMDAAIGCLSIQSYMPNAYDEKDLATLQTLADHCGGALARLHAQEALLKSESQLRLVWENSLEAMRLIDGEGKVVAVNDAYCRLVERSKELIEGKYFTDVYDEPSRQSRLQRHHEYFPARATPPTQEKELKFWNGRKMFLEMSNSYLEVPGQPTLLLTVFRDITKRKLEEQRTIAFARLTHSLSTASTPAEAAKVIRDVADALFGWDSCTVSLYSAETGQVYPIVYIDTQDGKRIETIRPLQAIQLSARSRRILEKGGELILKKPPFTISPDAMPFGDIARASASIMTVPIRHAEDVVGFLSIQNYAPNAYNETDLQLLQTIADQCGGALDRIRAEEKLKSSEARLHSVWENSADGMRLTDENGVIIAVNQAYCKMIGMEPHELEGQPFSVIFPEGEKNKEILEHYKERIQRKAVERIIQRRITFRSGKIVDIEGACSFVQSPGQKPLLLSIFRDVTEKKRLEEQLRHSQKMESVGQLAGGIAHDFNNLLTVIQGHTALLLQSQPKENEDTDSLQQIASAAERSANLTRQLLTFSRRQVIQPKNLDCNEVVNNMTKMLRRILGEDIFLLVLHSPGLPLVFADQGMMEQMLLNLAVNSRDAMPKGGELVINTSTITIDQAYTRQHPEAYPGPFVCLTVKDNGCGIPAENLPRIFEPFFTTKEIGKGTGLGLATVYGIVKQHRGWIKVSSTVGKGTTFQIFLPVSKEQSEAAEEQANKPTRGGNETILVVEDEAPLRNLVQFILQRLGYKVISAASGMSALDVWQEQKDKIDMVLTDLVMPDGLSGVELVQKLLAEKPNLKVVYTSGYSTEIVGKDFVLEEGINFLQKPYQPQKLAQTVRDSLDGK